MKKRIIALSLALMLTVTGCGMPGYDDEISKKPTTPPTETMTEDIPEIDPPVTTQPAGTDIQFPDVSEGIYFPLLVTFGNAELVETAPLDDNNVYFGYSNGSAEDLELFVTLCGYCGLFPSGGPKEDGSITYYLMRPGERFIAIASLMPDGHNIYIQAPKDFVGLEAPSLQVMMDYYMQELTLPTGYGPNVMPQFFASIGRTAADSNGWVSNIFRGDQANCWYEVYNDVDYATLHRYLSDMMLCGFQIKYDNAEFGDDNKIITASLLFNNGSSLVSVYYDALNSSAFVYYEPGVDRYLLSGTEYTSYIPQP